MNKEKDKNKESYVLNDSTNLYVSAKEVAKCALSTFKGDKEKARKVTIASVLPSPFLDAILKEIGE